MYTYIYTTLHQIYNTIHLFVAARVYVYYMHLYITILLVKFMFLTFISNTYCVQNLFVAAQVPGRQGQGDPDPVGGLA